MSKRTVNRQLKTLIKTGRLVKLNVGCGRDYKEGWINIDNNSDNNIERLDLNWDLRQPLPMADNSVDFIFNEHFVEHLTIEESQKAIKDFLRVLKPGGVLRIAMPNLKDSVELYLNPNWKKLPLIKDFELEFVETPAELLNMSFYWWGHKWLYDWPELSRRLTEIGCKKFYKATHSKSKYPDLRGLETRAQSTLIAEIVND